MKIIEVRPSKKFKGALVAFEAPGVEPAFAAPDAKRKAIDYVCGRFGGSAGEVHVYDEPGEIVERKIAVEVTANICRASVIKKISCGGQDFQLSSNLPFVSP